MPKGVYARKSARQKTAARGPAKVSPDAKPVQLSSVVTTPAAELAGKTEFTREDFRAVPLVDMRGPMLRAYARHVGVSQRDVDNLTEDRLRQNCTVLLIDQLED